MITHGSSGNPNLPAKTIEEPARQLPLYGEYEVAVLGGGVAAKAGRHALRADIFIDCPGDGDLAAGAGARFEVGDNAGSMLYPSMMFRRNGIDPEKAGDAWRTIPALMEQAEAAGTHRFPRKGAIVRPQRSQIEWRVNFTQLARSDGTAINGLEPDDLTRGEIDGRRQALNALHV